MTSSLCLADVRRDLLDRLKQASAALRDPGTPKQQKAELAHAVILIRRVLRDVGDCS